MIGLGNILSLLLGLVAWILPSISLFGKNNKNTKIIFLFLSISCCAVALWLQIAELTERSRLGDFAGIDDTIGAINSVAAILVVITIILNGIVVSKLLKKPE